MSEKDNPNKQKLQEAVNLPVIAAFYRADRTVRSMGWEDQRFPQVTLTPEIVKDPFYVRSKRLMWEASLRNCYPTAELRRFAIRREMITAQRQGDKEAEKLARAILRDVDHDPDAYKDWMN